MCVCVCVRCVWYVEISHYKFSEGKQVHVGMEASKTNQTNGNDTTTLSHHPYILQAFKMWE